MLQFTLKLVISYNRWTSRTLHHGVSYCLLALDDPSKLVPNKTFLSPANSTLNVPKSFPNIIHSWKSVRAKIIRGPFEKFVDSTYYSDSELCGGAVTVSFSKYLPWQAIRFLQRSTHFSKTCCRPLITSKFLAWELPFHGWKSLEISWGEIWTVWRMFKWGSTDPLFQAEHRIQFRSRSMRFLVFFNHEKRALKQEISKWSTVCSTFSRSGWCVVRNAWLAKGGTSKKRPLSHLHKVPTRNSKVCPRTFQKAIVSSFPRIWRSNFGCVWLCLWSLVSWRL
jgi:hypothetical protein